MKKFAALVTALCFITAVSPVFSADFNFPDYTKMMAESPKLALLDSEKTLEQKVSEDREKERAVNFGGSSGSSDYSSSSSDSAPCYSCEDDTEGILIIVGVVALCAVGFVLLLNALKPAPAAAE